MTVRVYVVGDSMSLGLAEWIERQSPFVYVVTSAGEGGTRIARILAVAQALVTSNRGCHVVAFGGHNDFQTAGGGIHNHPGPGNPADIVPAYRLMRAAVEAGGGKLLVIGLTGSPVAPLGSVTYDRLAEIDAQLELEHEPWFLDASTYLTGEAMADAGLIPTEQDRRDISAGVPPSSLRTRVGNPGHLNDVGKRVLGTKIGMVLAGLLSTPAPEPVPEPTPVPEPEPEPAPEPVPEPPVDPPLPPVPPPVEPPDPAPKRPRLWRWLWRWLRQ